MFILFKLLYCWKCSMYAYLEWLRSVRTLLELNPVCSTNPSRRSLYLSLALCLDHLVGDPIHAAVFSSDHCWGRGYRYFQGRFLFSELRREWVIPLLTARAYAVLKTHQSFLFLKYCLELKCKPLRLTIKNFGSCREDNQSLGSIRVIQKSSSIWVEM